MSALLELRDVTKVYRRGPEEIHALDCVRLVLSPGELVALVGPSGSGKTTLLNVIAGWEHIDEGTMTWEGGELRGGGRDLGWTNLSMLPQSLGLIEELSIRENVELPLRLTGRRDTAGVSRLLADLGLSELADRYPPETSLGEQQRAALCRSLVTGPKLVMADEPTGHQDVLWARRVLETIRAATSDSSACLMVTHHPAAAAFADRVLAIRDGALAPADHLDMALLGDEL